MIRLKGRFHIVYTFKFIRYGLILCLVPMVQALLRFDLASLYTALRQDAIILLCMAALSLLLWKGAGFRLTQQTLTLRLGFVFWATTTVQCSQVAVLEQSRPLFLRMLGATKVTLYAARSANFSKVKFYLPKHQAAMLAEYMLPVKTDSIFYEPTGAERIRFTVLSANIVTTAALLWVSARETVNILGADLEKRLNELAMHNLNRIEQLVELVLPASLAWMFTLVFVFWGIALFWSLLSTANFKASRSGGVILSKGGHVNHTERRILASTVSWCDVRITPVSRLLRRYPVYLCAGSYVGDDIPILVYKKGQVPLLQALMPDFVLCPYFTGSIKGRSFPQYIWKAGVFLGLSVALFCVSVWRLPDVSSLLCLPLALSIGMGLAALEGFLTEGIVNNENGTLGVQYTRLFTRHSLCVFTPDVAMSSSQNPFSENVARCNLSLRLPCRRKLRVRSIRQYQADSLKMPY